ncbi:MAG: HU family DNA-binding protein [Spirochaetota bacterium]|nr:HU family DNA-binding protein [Spirochaetota bacterium]
MNKSELVDAISKKSVLSKKDSEKVLNAFLETVKAVLKRGDKVSLVGFGTFQVMKRKATTGVNPKTKEKLQIPAKKVAKLKFSDSVNGMLNKK